MFVILLILQCSLGMAVKSLYLPQLCKKCILKLNLIYQVKTKLFLGVSNPHDKKIINVNLFGPVRDIYKCH